LPTEADGPPGAAPRGAPGTAAAAPPRGPRAARRAKPARAGQEVAGRPSRPSSRALRGVIEELSGARSKLAGASEELRSVDARVRGWDRSGAFLARRAHALHDEATARFAETLDELHALFVRLADRANPTLASAFSTRLRAAGTRRLQAQVRRELRGLQRAFESGGALLSRTLRAFDT
jgi:hypothetical protein